MSDTPSPTPNAAAADAITRKAEDPFLKFADGSLSGAPLDSQSEPGEDDPIRPTPTRLALQAFFFLLSMGLLAWCISTALRPENADKIRNLWSAPPGLVACLFGLSALSLILNGAQFWTVIRPIKRLAFWDVQAVNGIAAFASYAPFKLSLIARAIIHSRRDGVPVITVGAWMGAVAVLLLGAVAPLLAVSLWRHAIDFYFVVFGILGVAVMAGLIVGFARIFAGEPGLTRVKAIAAKVPLVDRLSHTQAYRKLHTGFDMLAPWRTVVVALAIRIVDLLVQAGRFLIAAQIVGMELTLDTALIAAIAFYVIGVASPSGSLGARESGTSGLAGILSIPGISAASFAPLTLIVSGTEILVNFTFGLMGTLWLKPWRLLRKPGRSGVNGVM